MIRRVALVLAALTAVSVTAGAAAVLPVTGSAPIQVFEPDAAPPPPVTDPLVTEAPHSGKVWVCVVLVQRGEWTLKPGRNPIEVAVNSEVASRATDPAHPSYTAATGDETCVLPAR